MAFGGVSYIAIVAAAIAGYAFSAVWYMALGRYWMVALGKTAEELKGHGPAARPFLIAAVAQLVMAFVLAGAVGHLGPGQVGPANGMISGGILWAGFVLTTIAVNHAFQGASAALTALDAGHWLGVLLLQGLVIGAMGV